MVADFVSFGADNQVKIQWILNRNNIKIDFADSIDEIVVYTVHKKQTSLYSMNPNVNKQERIWNKSRGVFQDLFMLVTITASYRLYSNDWYYSNETIWYVVG